MLNKDNVWIGLLVGLAVPFAAYGIFIMVFEQLDVAGITHGGLGNDYRARMIGLLAIAANIIPINIYRKNYHDNSMRGIVLATSAYVALWLYTYYDYFF